MGLTINTDIASITKPVIRGQEKPVAGRKVAKKPKEKKIEHSQPTPEQIELAKLYKKAQAVLRDLGFSLNIRGRIPLSDLIKSKIPHQLVKIYVNNKELADKLSRDLALNPNYFVVTDEAKDKVWAVIWKDDTENILWQILTIYAEKHEISLENKEKNTELFYQIIRKLTEGDPEIIAMTKEVKKGLGPSTDPLQEWNHMNSKVGTAPLRFVNFNDFDPSPSRSKIKPGKELESFIFDGGVRYRIKSNAALLKIIDKEAHKLKLDLTKISPREAVIFTAHIVEKYLSYNYKLLVDLYGQGERDIDQLVEMNLPSVPERVKAHDQSLMNEYQAKSRENDNQGADQILHKKLGVCRHYSQVFNAIFYTLKKKIPELANVYSSGVISNNHEWIMIANIEEKNGQKTITTTMIDPTADDYDGIFGNDLDASGFALNKYATAQLLLRLNRLDDFKKLLNENKNDLELQIFMLQTLAQKGFLKDEIFVEYEELSLNILTNEKCSKSHEFAVRKGLAYAYLERGRFDKAQEQLNKLKNQKLSYIDEHEEDLFYAHLHYFKGDLKKAEKHARKCAKYLEEKFLLAQILMPVSKDDTVLALFSEIEQSYDYSEFKLPIRLFIAETIAKRGGYADAKNYLASSKKYCRVRADRFAFTLSKARIEKENGKINAAEEIFAKIVHDYPDIFEENLTNIYTTNFDLADLHSFAKIASERENHVQENKLLLFAMKMMIGKTESYLEVYADAAGKITQALNFLQQN